MDASANTSPAHPSVPLTLRILGVASLSRTPGTGELPQLQLVGKQLALVAYLACAPEREASRDALIALLWSGTAHGDGGESALDHESATPEAPQARASNRSHADASHRRADAAFRNTLEQLRTKLGRDTLGPPRADPVRLALPLDCDRDAFIAACKRREDAAAVALYGGDFLPRMELLDAPPPFAQWVERERAHLRRLFIEAARRLATVAPGSNETSSHHIDLARQLQRLGESDDRVWQAILGSLLRDGPTDQATETAGHLRTLLLTREVEPSVEVRELLRRSGVAWQREQSVGASRKSRAAAQSDSTASQPLVGRQVELAAIEQAWDRALSGAMSHIHVVSPSGLGKSALLDHARNVLRSRSIGEPARRTLRARANQGARDIPYQFAADLASRLASRDGGLGIDAKHAAALVALTPTLKDHYRGARPLQGQLDSLHAQIATALGALLSALAKEGPIAVFLDDLHWSDDASLGLLASAWQQQSSARVLMVSAARTPCDALCRVTNGALLPLAPLSIDDIRALIEQSGRLPTESWAQELPSLLHEVSDGSPLLVQEQLALLADRKLLTRSGARWRTRDSDALRAALEERGATARRIERLAPEARDVLLWLTVAGLPLSSLQLQGVSGWTSQELSPHLDALAARNFVASHANEWRLAHDAHAAAVLQLATDSGITRASAAVGRVLASSVIDGADDKPLYADHVRQLQHAASLLVAGGDETSLAHIYRHATKRSRAMGDQRPNTRLAEEILRSVSTQATVGAPPHALGPNERLVPSLVQSLPWELRHRVAIQRAKWGALALTLVAMSAGVTRWIVSSRSSEPPPSAVLLAARLAEDSRSVSLYSMPLRTSDWSPATPLSTDFGVGPYATLPARGISETRQARLDGFAWIASHEAPDSGGIDLYELTKAGMERRLTSSPGDDLSPAWSPDNRQIVFSTARWNAMAQYDVATYDTLTGEVHQLTSGNDRDVTPIWSPDGSRIAFERQLWSGGSGICVVDADGAKTECHARQADGRLRLHGWINSRELLIERGIDSTRWELVRQDPSSGTVRAVARDFALQGTLTLSPDGRWVACRCALQSSQAPRWSVFPLEAPRDARLIDFASADSNRLTFSWLPLKSAPRFVSTLQILKGPGAALVGTPYKLRAEARAATDAIVDVGIVRWRALDSAVARIDSLGVVHAFAEGSVRIEASAGGWRRDTVDLSIAIDTPRTVFDERWTQGLTKSWVSFGEPRPVVVQDSSMGAAFFNNGDRFYFSGAYTADTFDVTRGLWIEALIATPIVPNSQWQEQLLTLLAGTDRGQLAKWDHVSGDMTPGDCRVYFPWGDGAHHADSIFIQNPPPSARVAAPPWLRSGRPFRALVQIFPDGRCGFALNDRQLWISPPAFFAASARAKIDGRSVGTRMLVGPLRVATGIAPQVRWVH